MIHNKNHTLEQVRIKIQLEQYPWNPGSMPKTLEISKINTIKYFADKVGSCLRQFQVFEKGLHDARIAIRFSSYGTHGYLKMG